MPGWYCSAALHGVLTTRKHAYRRAECMALSPACDVRGVFQASSSATGASFCDCNASTCSRGRTSRPGLLSRTREGYLTVHERYVVWERPGGLLRSQAVTIAPHAGELQGLHMIKAVQNKTALIGSWVCSEHCALVLERVVV